MLRALLFTALFSTSALAADSIRVTSGDHQTAVVELYTSEGCSSCPPADRWLSELVKTPDHELDVLALAFHVDYWNYLGWRDRFSDARYTSRQRQLGANNLQRTIYTPEFFVNGKEARGSGKILDKIQRANQQTASVELELIVKRDAKNLVLELRSIGRQDLAEHAHHRFLVYENNLATDVTRGENSGELLRHEQVVRYMSSAASLKHQTQHRIAIDPDWNPENIGVAVLVTSPGNEDYLQAIHTPIASLMMQP